MAASFTRGRTAPGMARRTAFNTEFQQAHDLAKAQQAIAANPYSKFVPDTRAAQRQAGAAIVKAPVGVANNSGVRDAKRPVIQDAGANAQASARGAFPPPGPRPAALASRVLGASGVPIGHRVGSTSHEGHEKPLAQRGLRAPTHLPPTRPAF